MPSRLNYLSVTFLEETPVGSNVFLTGQTVSLPEDVARGLGRSVAINGPGGLASAVPASVGSCFFNVKPSNTQKLRRAKANNAQSKFLFIGDSTTRGLNAGTAPPARNNELAGSYPIRLAARLAAAGIAVSTQNYAGSSSYTTAEMQLADPRISFNTTDWVYGPPGLGGPLLTCASATTPIAFTPAGTFDTILVFYSRGPSNGTFTVNVDGGATLLTQSCTGANAYLSATISCTLGTHTINIARSAGGGIFIDAVIAYNSTAPSISIINAAISGSTATTTWTVSSSPWFSFNAIPVMAPDVTFINLGINDRKIGADIPVPQFVTAMQSIINQCKLSGGDVILINPVNSAISACTVQVQEAYRNAIYSLALANDFPLIDLATALESQAVGLALGNYYDTLHPTNFGHGICADVLARMIISA